MTVAVFRGQRESRRGQDRPGKGRVNRLTRSCVTGSQRERGAGPAFMLFYIYHPPPARGARERGARARAGPAPPWLPGHRYHWAQAPHLRRGSGGDFAFRLKPPQISVPMRRDSLCALQPRRPLLDWGLGPSTAAHRELPETGSPPTRHRHSLFIRSRARLCTHAVSVGAACRRLGAGVCKTHGSRPSWSLEGTEH